MSVGVNHAALDSERKHQEDLLSELRELEEETSSPLLNNTQLPQLASSVGADLELNTKCLKYLTDISDLERYITDVAAQFAERSVELSKPNSVNSAVYTYKTLTDNVESCWDYVDQLASLTQIHLKSAAQYHQFFHEANELESKMERQIIIADNRSVLNPGRQMYKETSKLANEIREQLDVMRSLWDRSKTLVERSSHIVPMRLRLGGVAKGMVVDTETERPVMVRALTGLVGPNYSIQQGEHLRLIDNREDMRLWRVQTSTGIAEVPSVCFWLTGNDSEATNRAIAIKEKCRAVWLDLLERDRQLLYDNFTVIMTQLASEEHLYCFNYDVLNELLPDMRILLPNSGLNDGRLQAAVDKFQRKVIVKDAGERIPTSGLVLQEADLVRMRAPLLRLQDHLEGVGKMEAELRTIDERIAGYLSEVDNEREQVYNSIELLEFLMEKSQTQLKDIIDELGQWRRASPVQEMRMEYIRASKTKHHTEYYPELAETLQSPLGRFRSRSQPGTAKDPPRGRQKSPGTLKDSDYRRTRSALSKMDTITQIGYHSQQDVCPCQRTPREDSRLGQANTTKRSREFGSQVDNAMLRTLDANPTAQISPEGANVVQAPLLDDGRPRAEIHKAGTQVSTLVSREHLTEFAAESNRTQAGQKSMHSKMQSWLQCSIIASEKSSLTDAVESKSEMVNKKFQAVMPAINTEIQVGRRYSSNAAQTIEIKEAQEAVMRPTSAMESEITMRELSEVISTGTQAATVYHGKNLQVSVPQGLSVIAARSAKRQNKRVQVVPETRPEQIDTTLMIMETGCECQTDKRATLTSKAETEKTSRTPVSVTETENRSSYATTREGGLEELRTSDATRGHVTVSDGCGVTLVASAVSNSLTQYDPIRSGDMVCEGCGARVVVSDDSY
ncbi:unnamed protein product, partial [Dibothriocephalus latus]